MSVLGMPYDFGIDIWSVGCTLFELYTGKILFTGRSNNQMLRAIMECRGKFSHKILRKAQFVGLHFDDMLNFRSVEKDRLSGKVGASRCSPFGFCLVFLVESSLFLRVTDTNRAGRRPHPQFH